MSGHEILQYIQPFTEIGLDRQFDGSSRRIRHQSPHACQLLNLLIGTSRTRVRHHINIVVFVKSCKQDIGQLLIRIVPGLHHRAVSLFLRDEASAEIL